MIVLPADTVAPKDIIMKQHHWCNYYGLHDNSYVVAEVDLSYVHLSPLQLFKHNYTFILQSTTLAVANPQLLQYNRGL